MHPLSRADERFCAGLAPRWEGPYSILYKISPEVFVVDNGSQTKLHQNLIKLAHATNFSPVAPDHRPLKNRAESISTDSKPLEPQDRNPDALDSNNVPQHTFNLRKRPVKQNLNC